MRKLGIIFSLLFCGTLHSGYLFIEDIQNELMNELRLRGVYLAEYPSIRPYYNLKDRLDEHWLIERAMLPTLDIGWIYYNTTNLFRTKGKLSYHTDGFSLLVQPVFKIGKDGLHPLRYFKEKVAGDYERAYVRFHTDRFSFLLGRDRVSIGPSPYNNLLLGGEGFPLDMLMASYEERRFRFTFLFSRLEDIEARLVDFDNIEGYDRDTSRYLQRRYLAIRRLDFKPKRLLGLDIPWIKDITVGLSEATLFGGVGVLPDLYRLNPLVSGYIYQWIREEDANILWSIDTRVDLMGFAIYGQLLIDDFQYEPVPSREPNCIGLNIGIEFIDPFGFEQTFFNIEYTKVSRWTYTSIRPCTRYNYRGLPLGHPNGPDFDKFSVRGVYRPTRNLDITGRFFYRRKGNTSVETLWPIPPGETGSYFPYNNFLSGVVETSFNIKGGIRFYGLPGVTVIAEVGFGKANNFRHKEGKEKEIYSANLSALISF